jgi:hypothetical protein
MFSDAPSPTAFFLIRIVYNVRFPTLTLVHRTPFISQGHLVAAFLVTAGKPPPTTRLPLQPCKTTTTDLAVLYAMVDNLLVSISAAPLVVVAHTIVVYTASETTNVDVDFLTT